MKKIIFILILALSTNYILAQDSLKHHMVGASASNFSGIGISYRYLFDNGIGAKTSIIGWSLNDESDSGVDEDEFFSLGVEFQYTLHATKRNRLYLLFGFSYLYNYEKYEYSGSQSNEFNEFSESDNKRFDLGPALGLELMFFDNFTINFDIGLTYRNEQDESRYNYRYDTPPIIEEDKSTKTGIGFGGGIGLGYRF